jgi:hypothetical protein
MMIEGAHVRQVSSTCPYSVRFVISFPPISARLLNCKLKIRKGDHLGPRLDQDWDGAKNRRKYGFLPTEYSFERSNTAYQSLCRSPVRALRTITDHSMGNGYHIGQKSP